ncbi:hypothetical protein MASR1M36_17890 [Candidatus Cloacimonadaceae bacterium]
MKKILLVMFALIIASLLLAQTDITIGTGTTTGRYPFNDFYVYSRSQCIYLENEIGNPGTIHKLRWFRNDTGADANAIGTTQIWLKTVSNAVMTDVNWEDPGTMVAEISNIDLGAGNAWYEIDITDFAYSGGNLLVSAYTQNAPFTTPHSYWRYTATTGFNRCRLGNSDSSNPPTLSLSTARPNIQINMTAGAPSAAPNPAILAGPMNGGYAMIGDILSWNSGGGFPATYDVYFDTVDGSTLVSDNQTGLTYTPTLAPGTTYYWKVVPANGFGDAAGCPVWSFMTPGATQLTESFESTTFPPAGWANPGSWYRGTTYYKHGTAGAYKSGSTSATYVLSTPKVTITPTSTLNFWAAGSSTTTSILQIVYSADRVTWTQIGSNITPTSTYTMANYNIDLSSLAGNNYYLGFQTGSGAGTNYIDLVIGPDITPEVPGPAGLSTPADLAINVNEYPTFTWTAPTTGGVPTGYAVYCSTSNPPNYTTDLIGSTAGALTFTATTALAYETTYYWTVKAFNAAGDASIPTPRSFTTRANPTISTFPWEVNFGTVSGDWPVLNWSQLNGLYGSALTTGTQWFQDDFANVTTPLNKSAKINIYGTTRYGWLVTPPIAIPAAGYELKFDIALTDWNATVSPVAGEQADDKFIVLVDDNPNMTSPTILREWNNTGSPYVYDNVSNTGENHIIDLDAYTGTVYFAFYGESTVAGGDNDFFVDNVIVRETPAAPIFTYAPAAINFGTVMQNVAATAQNVTVTNTGGGTINLTTANISITGTDAAMFSYVAANLPAALAGGQSVTIPVTVTVTSEGAKTATLTINYNSVNYDVALSATGLPAGIVVIGDGTANNNLPINPFYGYTYSQSIFLQSEINVPDQRIESVYYYWNGVAEAVDSNDWTIYMGHTAATEFASTTDWMPLANLSQVFSGTIALPATAGWIEIPLTAPFIYNNTDNLVIAVDENAPSYDGSSQFFYSTAAATNRSLRYYSDSTNPDPAAPVAGTLVLAYPNVMLELGDIPAGPPEPVTLVSPANGATGMPIEGFNLTWTPAITGGTPTVYGVYLSQDPEDMYNGTYFETTATSLNPATYAEGPGDPIVFNFLDRYYWTVEAVNDEGSAVAEPPFSFQIEDAPQIITTFPWTENFDAALTAPADWTVSDVDGGGTNWVGSTAYAHSTPNAFVHNFSTAVDEPGQDGWLITPAVQVPAGNYYLSWWNYNVWPTYMVYNGVKVNTTNDPAAAGWTELWSQDTAASAWSQAVVSISAYAGQTVYFAFNYQGYDGDNWYIDDVSVYELTVDTFGPIISHLPVLNTPREDLPNYVVADIADDPTWNNPIGGANMYYSIDGGTNWSAPVAMTLDTAPTYYAQIPAQPLGTTVDYYIEAWDSLDNLTTSATFSYGVADPTWIWYDTGTGSYTWFGAGQAFSPIVLFDNPFYGTGNAVQVNAVDGMAYDVNASTSVSATLHVYSWDGVGGIADFVDVSGPIAVVLDHTTYETFDLSTYNIQIDTPYFVVSYDLPTGAAFLYDGTYDYGTSFANIGGTLYSMSNPGAWSIGANVQTGLSLALDTPVVTIADVAGAPTISWAAVTGANNYVVYGSDDPYAADPWTLVGTTTDLSYSYTGTEGMKFFKVVADSAAPTRNGVTLNKKNIRSLQANAQSLRTPKVLNIQKRNR